MVFSHFSLLCCHYVYAFVKKIHHLLFITLVDLWWIFGGSFLERICVFHGFLTKYGQYCIAISNIYVFLTFLVHSCMQVAFVLHNFIYDLFFLIVNDFLGAKSAFEVIFSITNFFYINVFYCSKKR